MAHAKKPPREPAVETRYVVQMRRLLQNSDSAYPTPPIAQTSCGGPAEVDLKDFRHGIQEHSRQHLAAVPMFVVARAAIADLAKAGHRDRVLALTI